MKHINKLFIVLAVLIVSSCSLTELELQDNPNAVTPENAETGLFFNAIQLNLANLFQNVNFSTSEVTRQLAMTGGNSYENAYGAVTFNGAWNIAYADVIPDIDQLIILTETEGSEVPHFAGASKIMKAYTLMTMVDLFGDIPYSESGQGVTNPSPIADSQSSIYDEALALLDAGIADMGKESAPITANDLFYGGDATKWVKLANTLKIKWYLNVGSGSAANGSDIAAAAGNAITTSADDFQFDYSTERDLPNSRHPWYNDGYEVGAGIYQSNYFMWSLVEEKGIMDPRARYYFYRQDLTPEEEIDAFTLDCGGQNAPLHYGNDQPFCHLEGGWWGRDHGNNDGIPPDDNRRSVAGVYPSGGLLDLDQGASAANSGVDGDLGAGLAPIMLSSFTHFMLAEAALTRSTGGDAAALLEEGVRQSITKVMDSGATQAASDTASLIPTMTDVDEYVELVMGQFNSAASTDDKLDVVMKEYHIALWGNGLEAYNGLRRTTFPSGLQPTLELQSGTFPRLMYYPADYLNLNANVSDQRNLADQVFWDTNPAGVIK